MSPVVDARGCLVTTTILVAGKTSASLRVREDDLPDDIEVVTSGSSDSYVQNTATRKQYLKTLVPHAIKCIEEANANLLAPRPDSSQDVQKVVPPVDCAPAHVSAETIRWYNEDADAADVRACIHAQFVLRNCTEALQPLDLVFNRPTKARLRVLMEAALIQHVYGSEHSNSVNPAERSAQQARLKDFSHRSFLIPRLTNEWIPASLRYVSDLKCNGARAGFPLITVTASWLREPRWPHIQIGVLLIHCWYGAYSLLSHGSPYPCLPTLPCCSSVSPTSKAEPYSSDKRPSMCYTGTIPGWGVGQSSRSSAL